MAIKPRAGDAPGRAAAWRAPGVPQYAGTDRSERGGGAAPSARARGGAGEVHDDAHRTSSGAPHRPLNDESSSVRRGTYWGTYGQEYAGELRQIHRTASTLAPPSADAAAGATKLNVHLPFQEKSAGRAPRSAWSHGGTRRRTRDALHSARRGAPRSATCAQRWSNTQPRGSKHKSVPAEMALSPLQLVRLFYVRYISCESCSQFDSLPLTS